MGLMVGLECVSGAVASELMARCREQGLLVNTAGGDTLRFVPPLVIGDEHVDEALGCLGAALERHAQQG
jgi:acetylornithine/succinyldiaminopimelate/putrescine aminotransferase